MTKTSKIKQSNFFCVHISSISFLKTKMYFYFFIFWARLITDNFFLGDELFIADIICFKLHSCNWNITLYNFLSLCNLICIFKNVHWIYIIVPNDNYVRLSIILPWLNEMISLSRAVKNEIQQIKFILIAFEGGWRLAPHIMRSILMKKKKTNDIILLHIKFLLCWWSSRSGKLKKFTNTCP